MARGDVKIKLKLLDEFTGNLRRARTQVKFMINGLKEMKQALQDINKKKTSRLQGPGLIKDSALKRGLAKIKTFGKEARKSTAKFFKEASSEIKKQIEGNTEDLIFSIKKAERRTRRLTQTLKQADRVSSSPGDKFKDRERRSNALRGIARDNKLDVSESITTRNRRAPLRPNEINEVSTALLRLETQARTTERRLKEFARFRGRNLQRVTKLLDGIKNAFKSIPAFIKRNRAAINRFGRGARTVLIGVAVTLRFLTRNFLRLFKVMAVKGARAAAGIKRSFLSVGSSLRSLLLPLSIFVGAGIFGLFRLGKSIIQTTANFETFRQQLRAVTQDAIRAESEFSAIREAAVKSPLTTEEFIASFVRLRAVGIPAAEAVTKKLANVAVIFNRDLRDVASAFIGVETEVLRRLGITLTRVGRRAIIEGNGIRKVIANDVEAIRDALLDVVDSFGNAQTIVENSLNAQFKVLTSLVQEIFADIGETVRPGLLLALKEFNKFLTSARPTIRKFTSVIFNDFKKLAALLNSLIDDVLNSFDTRSGVLVESFEGLSASIGKTLSGLIDIFIASLVTASVVVWDPFIAGASIAFDSIANEFRRMIALFVVGGKQNGLMSLLQGGSEVGKLLKGQTKMEGQEILGILPGISSQFSAKQLKSVLAKTGGKKVSLREFLEATGAFPSREAITKEIQIIEDELIRTTTRLKVFTKKELARQSDFVIAQSLEDSVDKLIGVKGKTTEGISKLGTGMVDSIKKMYAGIEKSTAGDRRVFSTAFSRLMEDRAFRDAQEQIRLGGELTIKSFQSLFRGLGPIKDRLKEIPDLMEKLLVNPRGIRDFSKYAELVEQFKALEAILRKFGELPSDDVVGNRIKANRTNFASIRKDFFEGGKFGAGPLNRSILRQAESRKEIERIVTEGGGKFNKKTSKQEDQGLFFRKLVGTDEGRGVATSLFLRDIKNVTSTAKDIFKSEFKSFKFDSALANELDVEKGGIFTQAVRDNIESRLEDPTQVREIFEKIRKEGGTQALNRETANLPEIIDLINRIEVKARLDRLQLPRLLQTIGETNKDFTSEFKAQFETFLKRPSRGLPVSPELFRKRIRNTGFQLSLFLKQLSKTSEITGKILAEVALDVPLRFREAFKKSSAAFNTEFLAKQSEQVKKVFTRDNIIGTLEADIIKFNKTLTESGAKTDSISFLRPVLDQIPRARSELIAIRDLFDSNMLSAKQFRIEAVRLVNTLSMEEFKSATGLPGLQKDEFVKSLSTGRSEDADSFLNESVGEGDKKRKETFGFGLSQGLEDLRVKFRDFAVEGKALINGLANTLESQLVSGIFAVVSGTKSAKEAFTDFAKSVLADLTKMIIKLLLFKAIQFGLNLFTAGGVGAFAGAAGGASAGFAGAGVGGAGGGVGAFAGALSGAAADGGVFQRRSSGITRMAKGGVTSEPTILFGEAGPEAFVPLPDGRSIPVSMQNGGGGGQTIVNLTINANDALSFQQMFTRSPGMLSQLLANESRRIPGARDAIRSSLG
jgi:hypothetical protein